MQQIYKHSHQTPFAPNWLIGIVSILLIGLTGFYVLLDVEIGASLSFWIVAIFALVGLIPGLFLALGARNRLLAILTSSYIIVILLTPMLDIGPRKPFIRAANQISTGMSIAEVDARMQGYQRTPANQGTISADNQIVYINQYGPGDSDALVVLIKDGQVIEHNISFD